jgi:hypothetical protein
MPSMLCHCANTAAPQRARSTSGQKTLRCPGPLILSNGRASQRPRDFSRLIFPSATAQSQVSKCVPAESGHSIPDHVSKGSPKADATAIDPVGLTARPMWSDDRGAHGSIKLILMCRAKPAQEQKKTVTLRQPCPVPPITSAAAWNGGTVSAHAAET